MENIYCAIHFQPLCNKMCTSLLSSDSNAEGQLQVKTSSLEFITMKQVWLFNAALRVGGKMYRVVSFLFEIKKLSTTL